MTRPIMVPVPAHIHAAMMRDLMSGGEPRNIAQEKFLESIKDKPELERAKLMLNWEIEKGTKFMAEAGRIYARVLPLAIQIDAQGNRTQNESMYQLVGSMSAMSVTLNSVESGGEPGDVYVSIRLASHGDTSAIILNSESPSDSVVKVVNDGFDKANAMFREVLEALAADSAHLEEIDYVNQRVRYAIGPDHVVPTNSRIACTGFMASVFPHAYMAQKLGDSLAERAKAEQEAKESASEEAKPCCDESPAETPDKPDLN